MESNKCLTVGTQVNSGQTKYTVEKILGQGGFGITYQVSATIKYGKIEQKARFAMKEHFLSDYCERDSTTSSVKFSAPVKEKVDESLRDFTAEARRLNSLDHTNIVAVNEVFEANDTAYYVMEYIEGKSLREFVKSNGTLSEKEALTIISPIINAVSYLHENHMTHLDIKPDNIMLKPTDNGGFTPILIDFGLSKHYDEKGKPTSTIRIQGCSNGYAPVEQYLGINSFSPTADVYALAATLYYLVVGKDPIIASELNQEVLTSSLPSSLSERTRNAIYNAMRMAKANRTQSVADFSRELGITLDRNSAPSVTPERPSCTQQIEKPQPQKDNNSTEIIFNETKHSSKKWLIPVIITLSLIIACALWWGSGFFGNESWWGWGDNNSSIVESSYNTPTQPTDSSVHLSELTSTIAELPAEEVIVEDSNDRQQNNEMSENAEIIEEKLENIYIINELDTTIHVEFIFRNNDLLLFPKDLNLLSEIATIMKNNLNRNYRVCGFSSTVSGSEKENVQRCYNSADLIKEKLISFGVNAEQITTEFGGATAIYDDISYYAVVIIVSD